MILRVFIRTQKQRGIVSYCDGQICLHFRDGNNIPKTVRMCRSTNDKIRIAKLYDEKKLRYMYDTCYHTVGIEIYKDRAIVFWDKRLKGGKGYIVNRGGQEVHVSHANLSANEKAGVQQFYKNRSRDEEYKRAPSISNETFELQRIQLFWKRAESLVI